MCTELTAQRFSWEKQLKLQIMASYTWSSHTSSLHFNQNQTEYWGCRQYCSLMEWVYVHCSSMTPCMLSWYLLMFLDLFLREKITFLPHRIVYRQQWQLTEQHWAVFCSNGGTILWGSALQWMQQVFSAWLFWSSVWPTWGDAEILRSCWICSVCIFFWMLVIN